MIARHFESGCWVEVALEGDSIASVTPIDGPVEVLDSDDWVAPAFWDLQINGRWGVSFSDPTLTVDQVAAIVRAQGGLGTARLCPTLITAPLADMLHGVRTIAEACDRFPDVGRMVLGIHLEGPSISEVDGYRGAHPLEAVRGPDWNEFLELVEASGNRIAIITLAPERPGAIDFIRRATAEGIVIALGHTSADSPTLRAAVEAGATLSTHLGNGIASPLARHPNPIWDQAADDGLWASLIADGHHLGPSILRALVRAKTPERIILVSDASPLAGLPPGRYGAWEVDPSGKIVVAGTPYLAGSNQGIEVGVDHLIRFAGTASPAGPRRAATRHPSRLLGRPREPEIKAGKPANLIRFRSGIRERTNPLRAGSHLRRMASGSGPRGGNCRKPLGHHPLDHGSGFAACPALTFRRGEVLRFHRSGLAMISSRKRQAIVGTFRVPCSQERTDLTLTPRNRANRAWLAFSIVRTSLTSLAWYDLGWRSSRTVRTVKRSSIGSPDSSASRNADRPATISDPSGESRSSSFIVSSSRRVTS